MLRKLWLALALACAVTPSYAQTAMTRAQLEAQNNTLITTNGQGGITGAILNRMLGNISASMLTLSDLSQTPASLNLANATGLPIAGLSGLGSGVSSALGASINSASGLVGNPNAIVTGTFTVGAGTQNAVSSFLNATVLADATALTVYNPSVPYTSTTTYSGLLAGLGANTAIEALSTYAANSIAGMAVQTNTSTLTFPTGVTGIGILNAVGSYSYGLFAPCYSFTNGSCVAAEFNSWNEHGDANGTFPLAGGFPDNNSEDVTLQLVAYGGFTSKSALNIASSVSNNGTPKYGYQGGIYVYAGATSLFGVMVDASSSLSPATAAKFRTAGATNNVNLNLQMMGSPASGAAFIQAYNSSGVSQFSVDGAGNVTNAPSASNAYFNAQAPSGDNALYRAYINSVFESSFGAIPNTPVAIVDQTNGAGTIVLGVNGSHNLTIGEGGSTTTTVAGQNILTASTTTAASLNIPQGTAPTTPNNGDVWMTSSGLFYRFNGTTHGPL